MFHPALLGEKLGKFLLSEGDNLSFLIKNQGSGTGSALV
jgi:hypothetical protein